jgi:biotin/methionine sulfoxide reductase
LAQGCTGQLTTVEVARFDGNLPPIQAYDPPVVSKSDKRDIEG